MPHSIHGTVVLMGSGETSASMVEVHKYAMSLVEGPLRAAFIDTPAGFQLNADLLAQKAAQYFEQRLQTPLQVASLKNAERATRQEMQGAISLLHEASYIFAGPGSPSYAIRNWRHTPIPDAIFETLAHGGCLAFASAAALTVGRFTIPVYEIYKVGTDPHWIEGLDILGHSGLDIAVVPHWNNNSGGDHDTRFCFMGEPRWQVLRDLLPASTTVLGIDEHTACILRIESNTAEVRGLGRVTLWQDGREQMFEAGSSFDLDLLRADGSAGTPPLIQPAEMPAGRVPSWEAVRAKHDALLASGQPPRESMADYVYDLLTLLSAAREQQAWQTARQAEEALREALVHILGALSAGPAEPAEVITPYVNLLLALRERLRESRQWEQADYIRDRLQSLGIVVQDGPSGATWKQAH